MLLARRCYLDANDVLLLKVMMMYRSTTQSEMGSREHLLLLSLPATDWLLWKIRRQFAHSLLQFCSFFPHSSHPPPSSPVLLTFFKRSRNSFWFCRSVCYTILHTSISNFMHFFFFFFPRQAKVMHRLSGHSVTHELLNSTFFESFPPLWLWLGPLGCHLWLSLKLRFRPGFWEKKSRWCTALHTCADFNSRLVGGY